MAEKALKPFTLFGLGQSESPAATLVKPLNLPSESRNVLPSGNVLSELAYDPHKQGTAGFFASILPVVESVARENWIQCVFFATTVCK